MSGLCNRWANYYTYIFILIRNLYLVHHEAIYFREDILNVRQLDRFLGVGDPDIVGNFVDDQCSSLEKYRRNLRSCAMRSLERVIYYVIWTYPGK